MDRRRFSLTAVSIAVLGGCGGGGGGAGIGFPLAGTPTPAPTPAPAPADPTAPAPPAPPAPPVPQPPAPPAPELASPTSLTAATVLSQSLPNLDNDAGVGPGQANHWDLTPEFCIGDGWNGQFANVLGLGVTAGGPVAGFPADQAYGELTALGPEMGAADGLKVVSTTTDPQFQSNGVAAYLHPVPEAWLRQTLDLRSAGGSVTLQWSGMWGTRRGHFNGEPAFMQVVLRDTSGALLSTLFRVEDGMQSGTWGFSWLTAFTGQVVVLSFEQCNYGQGTAIEAVSVDDSSPTPRSFVVNGDFSAGLTGWTVPPTRGVQNIQSGVRTLRGLHVQRSFFAQPDQAWARMTDTFHNPTAVPVTALATYTSYLGSYGAGVIYPPAGAPQKALSVWDGLGAGRDAGLVFGANGGLIYASATQLNTSNGDNRILAYFHLTVPAGGTATLANFLILTGTNTWIGAAGIAARATQVDAQAAAIVDGFRTDVAYQRGMTQLQLDTLKNF